jgi:TPR repeat protein
VIFAILLYLCIFFGLWFWIDTSSAGPYLRGQMLYQHRNYFEAMKWFQKAATKGNAYAEFYIGVEYEMGQGVPKDYREALNWYQKAADQGYTTAQERINALKRSMAIDK